MATNALIAQPMNPISIALPPIPGEHEIVSMKEMAKVVAYSGFLNSNASKQDITQRTADAFFVMMYGRELGVPAMTSLRQFYVIDGKPGCSGQLLLSLVKRAGVEVDIPDPASLVDKAAIRIRRPGGEWKTYTYTLQMAKDANLVESWGADGLKGKANWKKHWREMLIWRAFSTGSRFETPDITGGLYTLEELSPNTEVDETGAPLSDIFVVPPQPQASTQPPPTPPIQEGETTEVAETGATDQQPKQKKKPEWVTTENIDKLFSFLHGQSLSDSDIYRLTGMTPETKYGEWWWSYSTGKAAKEAILKAQADEMSSLPPSQPKGKQPPVEKENVWTDYDTHTLDELVVEYGLIATELVHSEMQIDGWKAFPTPQAARTALRQHAIDHAPRMDVKKLIYRKDYTEFIVGDLAIRAYGRDHFRTIPGSLVASECEKWEVGKTYSIADKTLSEPLAIRQGMWAQHTPKSGGEPYLMVEKGGLTLGDVPF